MPPPGYWFAAGCGGVDCCTGCWASAGIAIASAAAVTPRMPLMGIAPRCGNGDFDLVSRLFLHSRREKEQESDDDDEDDDERDDARHGGAFAERTSRCIAPSRIWKWGSVLNSP